MKLLIVLILNCLILKFMKLMISQHPLLIKNTFFSDFFRIEKISKANYFPPCVSSCWHDNTILHNDEISWRWTHDLPAIFKFHRPFNNVFLLFPIGLRQKIHLFKMEKIFDTNSTGECSFLFLF